MTTTKALFHVETAAGEILPEFASAEKALADYCKGDAANLTTDAEWRDDTSDGGPVQTKTIYQANRPEALLVKGGAL